MRLSILRLAAVASVGVLALSSCNNEKDYYDAEYAARLAAEAQATADSSFTAEFDKAFGNGYVGQDWTTVVTRGAQVTVSLGTSDLYYVGIYDRNPLVSGASALALLTVSDNKAQDVMFDAPYSLDHFFVAVFDGKGHVMAENVALTEGRLVASIGESSQKKAPTRATEEEATDYARTVANYLTPAQTDVTVKPITVDDMEAYPAITDDIIANETSNGNHNLSDLSWYYSPAAYVGGGDGKHFRVDADTEITEIFHINGTYGVVNDAVIYVQGKVHLKGNTLNSVTIVVADGGELVLDTEENHFSNNGRLVLMAGAKLTSSVDGATFNVNNGQWNYNAGEIDFNGTLNLNGSNFYNCGTVNVDVFTGTSQGSLFTNFGQITARTNRLQADSYNGNFINACYLHFTENAALGNLVLLGNSRVDIDGDAFFNGTQTLANASAIVVDGQSYIQSETIFNGPTASGSFAVFQTGSIKVSWLGNGDFNNNLYVDWNESECYDGNGNKYDMSNQWAAGYILKNKIEHWVQEETAPDFITIPAGDCTGVGYNTDDDDDQIIIPQEPVYYTLAFEDLGSTDDFDFNDIVLYIAHDVQTNKATVQLMAAGGTLPVVVKYDGTKIISKTGSDMINTFANTGFGEVIATARDLDFSNASVDLKKFTIEVDNSGISIIVSSSNVKGRAPQALIIPGRWAWPTERTRIDAAYPHFADWVSGSNDNGWYSDPVDSKVISAE